jgi:hypothetical protein
MGPAKDIRGAGAAFEREELRRELERERSPAEVQRLKRMAARLATPAERAAIGRENREARGSKLDSLKSARVRL